jgi:dolichol-phosphate mannosyltransferase
MRVVVVVPTYNERENVPQLIRALQAEFSLIPHRCEVLIVDDQSPDGTGSVVRALQQHARGLHLLSGRKQGLGAAYCRGMGHALAALRADVVFEMDADFSHDPRDVRRLLAAIEDGADFAIGSRYVPGGSIPREWGLHRKLISILGNVVARYVTGLYRIRDCTAGFRAIRASVLREVDLSKLRVRGYAFQVALLHACVSRGAAVREIPVAFVDRSRGESKLGWRDVAEFVANAWWIRLSSSRTFVKFAIVGASGVAVNLGLFTLLLAAGLNRFVASPLAIEASIVSNFLLNNYWTFRWRNAQGALALRGLKFNAVSLLSLAVSYGTFVGLSLLYPGQPPQLHQLVGIAPATLVNYFLNSYWTFAPPRRPNPRPRPLPTPPADR